MERQHRAREEIAEQCRCCDEGGVIVLFDSDEEAIGPIYPIRIGDRGHGCSKDGGYPPRNDDDDDDYTSFCKLLGMK
ncbi:putative WRKY transcription factor 35 [Hordeum vulgare]|nr:putative WRKY transcription factor 35 [Hordeum vulgare]